MRTRNFSLGIPSTFQNDLTWNSNSVPVIDYDKTLEQALTEASCYIARCRVPNGLRQVLHYSATKDSWVRRSNLPSWVLEWTHQKDRLQDPCCSFAEASPQFSKGIGSLSLYIRNSTCFNLPLQHRALGAGNCSTHCSFGCRWSRNWIFWKSLMKSASTNGTYNLPVNTRGLSDEELIDVYRTVYSLRLYESLKAANLWSDQHYDVSVLFNTLNRFNMALHQHESRSTIHSRFLLNIFRMIRAFGLSKDFFSEMKFARFCSARNRYCPNCNKARWCFAWSSTL